MALAMGPRVVSAVGAGARVWPVSTWLWTLFGERTKSGKTQKTKPARIISAKPINKVLGSQPDAGGIALAARSEGAVGDPVWVIASAGAAGAEVAISKVVACNGPVPTTPDAASVSLASMKAKRSPKVRAAPCCTAVIKGVKPAVSGG